MIEDQVKASPPRKAREFEKLEQAGLVPFYGSSAQQLIRHRIGGPTALRMQKRLVLGMGMLSEGQGDSGEEDDEVDDAELDHPSMLWDVYPEGISAGFLDGLDCEHSHGSAFWKSDIYQHSASSSTASIHHS